MQKWARRQQGFTIVELLIVIVVIAIIAAISIVTYSGIQQRAQNSAFASTANATVKALKMYYSQEGHYPVVDDVAPGALTCIGTVESLPADSSLDLEQGQCYKLEGGGSSSWGSEANISDGFNTQIQSVVSAVPGSSISYKGRASWSAASQVSVRGLMYSPGDSAGNSAYLIYFLKGSNQPCDVGITGFSIITAEGPGLTGATQCAYILQS